MLSAALYDLLEEVARRVKGSTEIFGGVRLIFVGDVAQLPPVSGFESKPNSTGGRASKKNAAASAFESPVWHRCQFVCYKLQHCYRYDITSRLGKFLSD